MRVLPLDMLCSHLHSFGTTGMSSGLATRVALTGVSWEAGRVLHWDGPASGFYFCSTVYDCCWVVYSRYTLLISLKILYDCASVYILMTRMASVMKNICSGNFISVLLHEDDCPLRCAV
jgi:hypothetical protein